MGSASEMARTKLGIVGAGGVGSAMAYASVIRNSASEVVLYDVAADRAEAEALDIAHGSMFAGGTPVVGGGDLEILRGCDMIIVTAGARQAPGQPRLELAGANVRILESLLPQLMKVSPEAVYMFVTNPCDVLTVVAQQVTGLPRERVFSYGTVLDSSRLRWMVGREAEVSTSSVHAMIVGEHGDSEFPLWSQANIGQVPIDEWTTASGEQLFSEEKKSALAEQAMRAAYRVIQGKGSTNYAIGLSGARIAEAVLMGQNSVLPVSTVLDDYYGVSDIALSVPTLVGYGGAQRTLQVPMDEREIELLQRSAETLESSLRSLGFSS